MGEVGEVEAKGKPRRGSRSSRFFLVLLAAQRLHSTTLYKPRPAHTMSSE